MRLLTTTALFSVVTGALLVAWESRRIEAPASAVAGAPITYQSPLGLSVAARRQQVEIRWDHDLRGVLKPAKGLMKITEGELVKLIPLDWRDLQDGYVSYIPVTSDVKVRFEVTGGDGGIVTESAHVTAIP